MKQYFKNSNNNKPL